MSARLTTSLNFVGSKVICCVCRSMSTAKFLALLSPTCRFRSPTGDKPYPLHRGNLLFSYISPSTWGNQRRARSHYHHSLIILPARPGGRPRQGGAWTPWSSSPAPLRL